MKASSHEKHAKQQLKNKKKNNKKKSSDPWPRSGERPGRGHGSELFVFFVFFGFSMVFCSLAKTSRRPKKKFRHTTKKNKKKQETKKNKKSKKQKKIKKKIAHPKGRGSDAECWVLSFFFYFFYFCFFVFLVFCLAVSSLACWHSALACQHSRAQHSLQCIFPGVHPSRYVYLDLDSGCFYWNRKNALE